MRRVVIALLASIVATLGATAPAEARDMGGSFGLGVDTSLSLSREAFDGVHPGRENGIETGVILPSPALPGLAATLQVTKALGFQLIGTLATDSIEPDSSYSAVGVSMRALFAFEFTTDAHLGLVGGVSLMFLDREDPAYETSGTGIGGEIGLRPEWFLSEHFSLHTQIGVSIASWGWDDDRNPGDDPPVRSRNGFVIDAFANANLLGNAGFTYWF